MFITFFLFSLNITTNNTFILCIIEEGEGEQEQLGEGDFSPPFGFEAFLI